ncbi:hypothetical protein [Dactylosporangium cerinum]
MKLLATLAQALAAAGEPQTARRVLGDADAAARDAPEQQMADDMSELAKAYVAIGDVDRAHGMLAELEGWVRDALQGDDLLEATATIAAMTSDYVRAESIARTISDVERQGEALAAIADLIPDQEGATPLRQLILAEATAKGSWLTRAFHIYHQVEPAVLQRFIDDQILRMATSS